MDSEVVNTLVTVIAWVNVIFIPLIETIVFVLIYKKGGKMDKAAIFCLLLYVAVAVVRMLFDAYSYKLNGSMKAILDLLSTISCLLSYALLYFFVFEMLFVLAILKANTLKEKNSFE